jgi:hypothetical protein
MSTRATTLTILVALLAIAATARADEPVVRSRLPVGGAVVPDRVAVTISAGWSGAGSRLLGGAILEAALASRISVIAGAELAQSGTHARPTAGVAFQLADPRVAPVGARVSIVYKPEGLTEPEGEVEGAVVLSRRLAGGLASLAVTYGQDPEGRERDGELAGSFLAPVGPRFAVGATGRGRHAIGTPGPGEPTWDTLGGAVGVVAVGRYRGELILGAEAVNAGAGADAGVLGLVGFGADL